MSVSDIVFYCAIVNNNGNLYQKTKLKIQIYICMYKYIQIKFYGVHIVSNSPSQNDTSIHKNKFNLLMTVHS